MAFLSVDIFNKKCTASATVTRKIEVSCGNFSICMSNDEAAELVLQIALAMQANGLSRAEMAEGDQTAERG